MMHTMITNLTIILRFFLTHSSNMNQKEVRKHKTFFLIHDTFLIALGIFGFLLVVGAVGTFELSTSVGPEFRYDYLILFRNAGIGFGILVLIATFNDIWDN